jgi:hypothetical protein
MGLISKVFIISLNTMSLFFSSLMFAISFHIYRDILTKELSKICKFFVLLCLRILFAWDKSSIVLCQDTILKLRTVLFRNVLHKLEIFQGI